MSETALCLIILAAFAAGFLVGGVAAFAWYARRLRQLARLQLIETAAAALILAYTWWSA